MPSKKSRAGKPSRKTAGARIAAAVKELSKMGVDVPDLLEQLEDQERILVSWGGGQRGLDQALRLPRSLAVAFPLMAPSLMWHLFRVRVDLLRGMEGLPGKFFPVTPAAELRSHLDAFITSIRFGNRKRGRPTSGFPSLIQAEVRAAFRRACRAGLLSKGRLNADNVFQRVRPFLRGVDAVEKREWLVKKVEEKRNLVDSFRRGKQGMSWEQAAGRLADALADDLADQWVTEFAPEWPLSRKRPA